MKTVVRMKFGSHLYGTNTPESDTDFKSVFLPDAEDILLQRVPRSINKQRNKAEGERNQPGDIDEESFSLQQFLALLAQGQTVALDMLFAPETWPTDETGLWTIIRNNRDKLLTKKSAAFVGYCRTQANKYGIKGSRVAAAKAAAEFFNELMEIGLPSSKLSAFRKDLGLLVSWHPDHMGIVEQVVNRDGDIGEFFECCNRKVGFGNTIKEAQAVFNRIYDNYGDRARKAQDNEGVDWKALSHAVRVGHQALELLRDHNITFPLPNAAHILDIKLGRLPYQVVADEIEQLLVKVEEAEKTSTLPDKVDSGFIDSLVHDHYEHIIISKYHYNI